MAYKVEIVKLNDDNFPLWKTTIRNELRAADAEIFVMKDIRPSEVDVKDARRYWQAASMITSSVSRELAHLVITESDDPDQGYPYLLWKRIENHFMPLNSASKHRLKVEFFHLKLEDLEETTRFITRINEYATKVNMVLSALKKSEGFICEDDKLSVLLAGIENEFPIDHAVLSKDQNLEYKAACTYVVQNCKKKEKMDSADKLQFTGGSGESKSSKKPHGDSNGSKKGKKSMKCFKCGGKGHKAAECATKKSNGRSEGKNETVLALYDEIFALERSAPGNYIMIDTGCTRHICGRGT